MNNIGNLIMGFGIALVLFVLIFLIAYLVFSLVGQYKLFKKAGYNGWEAIVPFYNQWVLTKIVGLKEYWFVGLVASSIITVITDEGFLFILASIVSLIARIAVSYNLSKKFHKPEWWFVLSIFFSGVTYPILGYPSSDKYDKDLEVCENAFFNK